MQSSNKNSAFSQTLQFITSIKLQELDKQRLAYQAHAKVLETADSIDTDLIAKVELLLEAVQSWSGSGAIDHIGGQLNVNNMKMFLPQAKKDPSFNPDILKNWIDSMETHIRHNLMRFECAKLFGNLFNEWLASGDSATNVNSLSGESDDADPTTLSQFVDVGRKEKHEQQERLTSIVFDEAAVDPERLVAYLTDLFSGEEAEKILKSVRSAVEFFGSDLRRKLILNSDVKNAIRGLLAAGLMDEGKRATLAEFLENSTVITEVASVLNMRMASLDTWAWPSEGLTIEMRRHLNGKYRAFTDPEIIDALLLQYIGVAWQIQFKRNFKRIFSSKAWTRAPKVPFTENQQPIREQLGIKSGKSGIEYSREQLRERHFFLSGLTTTARELKSYDDLLDAPSSSGDYGPAETKKKLLHFMTTECRLNTTLKGTHAIIRSDIEWFGPSLPHSSILALLKFFGISSQWLAFFEAFLRAPLRFKQDPPGETRIRKRGTPIAYALSMLCGEVVLFGMDFAVNQKASGLFLHRMHDDLWLWDADAEKCAAGWEEMNIYAELVGLKFNKSKTGSAWVGPGQPAGLPAGDIRWGLLSFDPKQARFIVNQEDVDGHIVELRRQLAATKSIFGWVNAYNKYMAFFVRNFGGRPALCFDNVHVTDMIDTLAKIQRELFPSTEGGPVGYLRTVIEKRFDIRDLPSGYFYLPIARGGMELRNPMIEMLSAETETWKTTAEEKIKDQMKRDEETYNALKATWLEKRGRGRGQFMSFEEYTALRESWLRDWMACYDRMLLDAKISHPQLTGVVKALTPEYKWDSMDWYEKWVISLHGEEVAKRFGGLNIVDATLIPVGMVQLFKTSRMKLDE